jgi:hypothetical protein
VARADRGGKGQLQRPGPAGVKSDHCLRGAGGGHRPHARRVLLDPGRAPVGLVPSSSSSSPSISTPSTTLQAQGGPAIPNDGAYPGAWLHPVSASTGSAFAVEQQSIPAVTAVTGRRLGILHIYSKWTQPAPVSDLETVTAAGSVPLLDWGCGDTSPPERRCR